MQNTTITIDSTPIINANTLKEMLAHVEKITKELKLAIGKQAIIECKKEEQEEINKLPQHGEWFDREDHAIEFYNYLANKNNALLLRPYNAKDSWAHYWAERKYDFQRHDFIVLWD